MNGEFDVAVVGSGFAGSLTAMIARQLGRSVVLLERGRHPRFAIGESSTPLANLLLEELAGRYGLPEIAPFAKWGSWQERRAEIACGLKRGFTFYHHPWNRPFEDDPERSRQLLVAASPHDRIADTHWYREELDQFFALAAQARGVEFLDRIDLRFERNDEQGMSLSGSRGSESVAIRARFVIDATGPRGFLHRELTLPEERVDFLPETEALFAHFEGVERFAEEPLAPFPPDDAALHHLFPGGWIWVLRFNNGRTSAGVSASRRLARELDFAAGEAGWRRLLAHLPSVGRQFATARACRAFTHQPRLAFRSGRIAGPNWALLPSAAGFVDPLLSTGFALTLLGVERLAKILEQDWRSAPPAGELAGYAAETAAELAVTEELCAALHANLAEPALFRALTMLYFAAASFAEAARRLERPALAAGFLLHRREGYGTALRACLEEARRNPSERERRELAGRIWRLVEPIDVAGLGSAGRRNWYPALAEDLLGSASKLGVERQQALAALERCGFVEPRPS